MKRLENHSHLVIRVLNADHLVWHPFQEQAQSVQTQIVNVLQASTTTKSFANALARSSVKLHASMVLFKIP